MQTPIFVDGSDKTTFAPFELIDSSESRFGGFRLVLRNCSSWLIDTYGSDTIDGVHITSVSIPCLIIAARFDAGLDPFSRLEFVVFEEGPGLYLNDLEGAIETATLAQTVIQDRDKIRALVDVAKRMNYWL